MNRHLLNLALSVIAGIMAVANRADIVIVKTFIILLVFLHIFTSIVFKRHFFAVSILGIVLGIVLVLNCDASCNKFYNDVKNKDLNGEIIVTKDVKNLEDYHSFYGELQKVNDEKTSRTVYVTYYGDKDIKLNDIVSFKKGEITLHDENMNKGGFNYRNYYKSENAHFKLTFDEMKIEGSGGSFPSKQAREISMAIKERINNTFSSEDTKTFFTGLFLGDKTMLTPYVENTFKSMGISHVLAVSGMHVVLLITLFGSLLSLFKPKPLTFNIILGCVLFLFCFVTGLEPSVIRASIIAIIVTFSVPFDREYDSATALSFAALFMLFLNPYVVFGVSFQLSFMAALGISTMAGKITEKFKFMPKQFVEVMAVTFSATFATLPVIINTFGYLSPLVFVGNLIIVPLLPLIYVLGIISSISGFYPLTYATDYVFTKVLNYLDFFARTFTDKIYVPMENYIILSAWLLVILMLIVLLKCVKINYKTILTVVLLPVLVLSVGFFSADKDKLEVTFINVGQSDCALLSLGGKNILIDSGTEKVCNYEIIPFLRRKGINKIDKIIVSHFHEDHAGGVLALLDEFEAGEIIVPDTLGENEIKNSILNIKSVPVTIAKTDDLIEFGKAELKVVSDFKTNYDENDSSLVLKLTYGKDKYLFTGDAEFASENKIKDADADVLKVGHHGGETSTNSTFLERVTPSYAIISVGKNNQYGHPHLETISRLKASGSKIYITYQWKEIEFASIGE